jgi:general secretion pathway protein D
VVGKLFQSSSTTTIKKNLMVFLRPTIIINSDAAIATSNEKYNYIKAKQIFSNGSSSIIDLTKTNNQ